MVQRSSVFISGSYKNGNEFLKNEEKKIREKSQKITPLNNILKFRDTKIQMISVTNDPYIPYDGVKEFIAEAEKITKIEVFLLHKDNHSVGEEEFKRSVCFVLDKE